MDLEYTTYTADAFLPTSSAVSLVIDLSPPSIFQVRCAALAAAIAIAITVAAGVQPPFPHFHVLPRLYSPYS